MRFGRDVGLRLVSATDEIAVPPQTIYFDEAGYTGNRLLERDQPHFVYASVALGEEVARQTVADVIGMFRLQGQELKGKNLTKHGRGQAAIEEVLRRHIGDAHINIYDKEYALACKFFEYTFEPVLASCSSTFYAAGFHRFIGNLLYLELRARQTTIQDVFIRFEELMRTGDCSGLRALLDPSGLGGGLMPPTNAALLFAAIHETKIREEVLTATTNPDGKSWVLDLSMGAVFNMLQHWGQRYAALKVVCDRSRPLKVHELSFNAMIGREDKVSMSLGGDEWPLVFNLAEPIHLVDSRSSPGVQIADVIASATAHALCTPGEPVSKRWLPLLLPRIGPSSVVTDLREFRPDSELAFLGVFILDELLRRATQQESPCDGMAELIAAARRFYPEYLAARGNAG